MKIPTIRAAWALAGAALVLVGVWLFVPRGMESVYAGTTDSFLYNYEGNVVATIKGISNPAQLDMRVNKGDSFKTGADSQFDLTAGEYAGFRLLADGEIQIVAIQQTRYVIQLNKGTLLGNLKQLPGGMTVEIDTPTSIGRINVSGTQFVIHVRPEPEVKNKKLEHKVSFVVRKGRMDAYIKKASAAVSVIEGVALDLTPETYIPSTHTASDEELAILKTVNQVPILVIYDDK